MKNIIIIILISCLTASAMDLQVENCTTNSIPIESDYGILWFAPGTSKMTIYSHLYRNNNCIATNGVTGKVKVLAYDTGISTDCYYEYDKTVFDWFLRGFYVAFGFGMFGLGAHILRKLARHTVEPE